MGRPGVAWVVILDRAIAARVLADRARRLPLDADITTRPAAGDRLALLAVRGPRFVTDAIFVGTAEVLRDDGDSLAMRHRVLAPQGHTTALAALRPLRCSAGWTHDALGALRGSVVRSSAGDHRRIEAALLADARAYGPAPKRPRHRRPRTPGRRALLAGRAAAGWRPG